MTSCADNSKPWDGVPANYYGDLVWAQYNLTCIKDAKSNEWCSGKTIDERCLLVAEEIRLRL